MQVIAMTASLVNGGDTGVVGSITSGGTESILMVSCRCTLLLSAATPLAAVARTLALCHDSAGCRCAHSRSLPRLRLPLRALLLSAATPLKLLRKC